MAHPLHGGWTAQEELSCLARNDGARTDRGRKLRRRCCAEAVEAKTSFGQISPLPEAVGRGLGQTGRGDQGDQEGPEGETGLAHQAMRPLGPLGLRALPPALPPRGNRPPWVLVCPSMAEQQTILERPGRDWAKMLVDQGCGLQHLRPIR